MADLRLPYPNGPRIGDNPCERRRKIAENLDAIADWCRGQGEMFIGSSEPGAVMEFRRAAIAIDKFEDAIR